MSSQTIKKVVIIGGGISGLAAAFKLKQLAAANSSNNQSNSANIAITLLEAGSRFGGVIRTEFAEGCLLECGPDAMLSTKPAGVRLMKALGMTSEILETEAENRRAFIANEQELLPMPDGFRLIAPESIAALAASPCLSLRGKLRAMIEPLISRHQAMQAGNLPDDFDESLANFVSRRMGKEALDKLAQPLFSGIYTADPEALSMRATMPQFLEYEAEYGSVVRGLKSISQASALPKKSSGESVRYSIFVAPRKGMESLVDGLLSNLSGVDLRLNAPVKTVSHQNNWKLELNSGELLEADALILSLPAPNAAAVIQKCDAQLSELLSTVKYASSAVINFIFERENILHPLNGFGFVVPAYLKKNILAASFSSVKFAGRAPEQLAIVRAFVGGALFPETLEMDDSQLRDAALGDLTHYLSIKAPARGLPYKFAQVTRWPGSMPQYAVGHRRVVKNIETRLNNLPGLFACGAVFDGVGLPDCIRSGESAAKSAYDSLVADT